MRKVISYKNAALTYNVHGEGETVMLLHGFAETGSIWNAQAFFLSKYYQVIVPDLPGWGLRNCLIQAMKS